METKIVNFKKLEIVGESKDAAIAAANLGFDVAGDATQAYKNWLKLQTGAITEKNVKQFMLDYLQKKVKSASGVGYAITIESAVADTRERPYTILDVKNEKGKRKYTTTYRLVDDATGATIGTSQETKAAAKNLAKELILKGFHGKGTCYYDKVVTEGEPVAFRFQYTPSKSQRNGRWLVFGIER